MCGSCILFGVVDGVGGMAGSGYIGHFAVLRDMVVVAVVGDSGVVGVMDELEGSGKRRFSVRVVGSAIGVRVREGGSED